MRSRHKIDGLVIFIHQELN